MQLADFFKASERSAATHSWQLVECFDNQVTNINDLAKHLAELIIKHKCSGCPEKYDLWKSHLDTQSPIPSTAKAALKAFIRPICGLPETPQQPDHLEGNIAQYLWYFLSQGGFSDIDIVRIERPGFSVTDPGGDGLIIHKLTQSTFMFRLWEIKKCSGTSPVSSTIRNAYDQLNSRAMEYLARYTAVGQQITDQQLSSFYGQLVDLWIDARPEAAAGVSVTSKGTNKSSQCFTTFGKHFPQFTSPIRLRGMLITIEDFSSFATQVREFIWKGL